MLSGGTSPSEVLSGCAVHGQDIKFIRATHLFESKWSVSLRRVFEVARLELHGCVL